MRTGPCPYLACIALGLLALSPSLAQAPPANREAGDFTLRKLEWTGTPQAADAHVVDVFNPYGDIRMRPSESPEVVASGVVQELTPDQPPAELDVTQEVGRTTIRVALPEGVEQFPGRVDLAVLVPTWVDVTARTLDGAIMTKSLRGKVAAHTRSGSITAIFKKLTRDAGGSAILLESETGAIEAQFLVDMDLRVHVTTAGPLQTMIPNDLVDGVRRYKGMLTGKLGEGRHPVTIRSATGSVVLRLPNATKDESGDGGKQ